jgi:hypothetical protein
MAYYSSDSLYLHISCPLYPVTRVVSINMRKRHHNLSVGQKEARTLINTKVPTGYSSSRSEFHIYTYCTLITQRIQNDFMIIDYS